MPQKTSLSDEQIELRETYMRLYRSFSDEDQYYPAVLMGASQIKPLLDAGHAICVTGGYRITEEGLLHWAKLNERTLKSRIYNKSRIMDPLRKALGMPTLKVRPRLSKRQKQLLVQIGRVPLNTSGVPKRLMGSINSLIKHGLLMLQEGYACITEEGQEEIWLIFQNKEIAMDLPYDPEIVDLSLRCDVQPPVLALLAKAMPDADHLKNLLTTIKEAS